MANVKITELPELTAPAAADLLEIVDDVAGTPTSKKVTVGNILSDRASKTTAILSKTIGSGGDYATFAAAIADCPNLIANPVIYTSKAGTTLTETCTIANKHGITSAGHIEIKAEKYFPTSGEIPTADSATATTLRDAALATAALGDDYFNGCWVFIVDGTGTDNGFVPITDYVDATGDVVVASWPGTQPDNTSRYLIVGALIDGYSFHLLNNSINIFLKGIGLNASASGYGGYRIWANRQIYMKYCGVYGCTFSGISCLNNSRADPQYCGIVGNNTSSNSDEAGIKISDGCSIVRVYYCGISDNNNYGIICSYNSFGNEWNCFGDGNGTFGLYAMVSSSGGITGSGCSGSSGTHSNGVGDGSLTY